MTSSCIIFGLEISVQIAKISHSTIIQLRSNGLSLGGSFARNLYCTEVNIANYTKGDFINIHRDSGKGKFAVTLSLTSDWNPSYGGLLHFVDGSNVIDTVVPHLGNIVIFEINEKSDHFVSPVNVEKNRYMISAWYDCRPTSTT